MDDKVQKLLEIIGEIVSEQGTWQEKRDSIMRTADVVGNASDLLEFVSWFE